MMMKTRLGLVATAALGLTGCAGKVGTPETGPGPGTPSVRIESVELVGTLSEPATVVVNGHPDGDGASDRAFVVSTSTAIPLALEIIATDDAGNETRRTIELR